MSSLSSENASGVYESAVTLLQELMLLPEIAYDRLLIYTNQLLHGQVRAEHVVDAVRQQLSDIVLALFVSIVSVADATRRTINGVCVGLEAWQIAAYTFFLAILIVWLHDTISGRSGANAGTSSLRKRIARRFFVFVRGLPIVRQYIAGEIRKNREKLFDEVRKADGALATSYHTRLPPKGIDAASVLRESQAYAALGKYNWNDGRVSGAVYNGEPRLTKLLTGVYEQFAWSNPLHPDIFPGVRKMEAEVVRMCLNMFHGDANTCGTMTSGGTESILLACLAYRNRAYERGIEMPEIVAPISAHAAFDKACELFCIKLTHIPVDKRTLKADVRAMRRAINSNVCALVGSAPSFPHGVVDDIDAIAKLGKQYGIPVHVDACLGGFLIAFMEEAGFALPHAFDFSLPGVTSISCDTHKYGFASKGTSVVLYRNFDDYLRHQLFCTPDWPGGIYASPTLAGSRCGANIATCWATLLFYGRDGYVEATKEIVGATRELAKRLRNVDGVQVMGEVDEPLVNIVTLTSKRFDIYAMSDALNERGWNLSTLQFPPAIHLCLTACHTRAGVVERFTADVSTVAKQLIAAAASKGSDKVPQGKAALYGMAQTIPDRSIVAEFAHLYTQACYSTVSAAVN